MELRIDKSNWKKVKLRDVAYEYSKRINNPSESEFDRFVGSSNISQWDFRVKSWESTDSVTSAMKLFEPNDYLLVRRSLYASDFRERAPRADFSGVCSGDILTIKENPKMVADGFLIGILNSPALWEFVVANASGSITRRIKWRDLANYEFLLPPKDQQAKLAELLWAMDEVIQLNLRSIESISKLYRSEREFEILKNGNTTSFVYNKRLKAEVHENIQFIKLNEILKDIRYGTSKKGNSEMKGVPVLGIPNVIQEKLSFDNLNYCELEDRELESCMLSRGDIVIIRTNGNSEYTGKSALYNVDDKLAFASYLIKVSVDTEVIDPEFLVRFLQTNAARRYFKRHATSTAGNYNINTETIKGIIVPMHSKERQQSIVAKLKSIEKSSDELSRHSLRSKALQKSLINQIF
jgi:restriction endonuclease S subunit